MNPERDDDIMERRSSHIDLADKINRLELTIAKGMSDLCASNEMMKQDMRRLSESQDRVTHAVYGNGKEGLITKVSKMNQKLGIMWYVVWFMGVNLFAALGYFVSETIQRIPQ